jgi:hypothetical protein
MEGIYYFCLMPSNYKIAYFKFNIAGLVAPESSFMLLGGYIGSSNSQSSISDFIENKTKCVGKFISLSMSQISFCKYLKPVKALLSSNFRPNLNLQLPKLSFNRLNLYQTDW